ncbi:sortase [Bifidobacterium biavatii]|uniref:Peptidase C60, sortase A and B n=1 Tax=Bifidobacterium biavatii DSM 23969 TaxID=1437608 RepID=A0A086ZHU5_9BIFI|nr:sortase [Bifidobacterium biavatii]KFI46095.1 peptidase C60, sortase A and B [Bifidobacterium biavatii DSM 23969]
MLLGVIALTFLFTVTQFVWQYWGASFDTVSTTKRIETEHHWKVSKPVKVTSTTRVAEPRYSEPPAEAEPKYGDVIGHIYIPRLGSDWDRLIQEGTGIDVLNNLGLGHFENTSMPGQLGVTAFAGHRQPVNLWALDTVVKGDAVVIRTEHYWYVYRITRLEIVDKTDTSVLDPVSGERTLVLSTCDPKWVAVDPQNRLIAHAVFDYWSPVSDGTVRELTGPADTKRTVESTITTVSTRIATVTNDAPVTPTLAIVCLGTWLVMDMLFWLIDRNRSWTRLARQGWWNVIVLLWRVQAGPLPVRLLLSLVMWTGMVFSCFAWACPWVAGTIPILSTPYPGLG